MIDGHIRLLHTLEYVNLDMSGYVKVRG